MKKIAIAICVLLTNSLFAAAPISISGQGTAPYTNLFGKPDKAVEDLAKANALTDAIERALENQPEAFRQQFKSSGSVIKLEEYFSKKLVKELSTTLINDDKVEKTLTVQFQGNLDITALRDALNALPKNQIPESAVSRSEDKAVVFMTVRETESNTSFDAEVVIENSNQKISQSESEATGNVEATDEGTSKTESSAKKASVKTKQKTGGAATRIKSDEQVYRLDKASKNGFGSGLRARFLNKGMQKIKNGGMFKCSKDLDEAFALGDDVDADTWEKVFTEVRTREPSVKFAIVGTLDFSAPSQDLNSGFSVINGTVTGAVFPVEGDGIPDAVAELPPMHFKASAESQQDAKKAVVTRLSELAADEIITTLHNNGAF